MTNPLENPKNAAVKIILTTLNATYQHTAFGLRYLYAQMGELQPFTSIQEYTIAAHIPDLAEKLLIDKPDIIGFGVYIWNTTETEELIGIIKKISPKTLICLGGPEVSYEAEKQKLFELADYVFIGESDFSFRDFAANFFHHQQLPDTKIIRADLPDIKKIKLPYSYYNDEDIKNRVIYVEASRGCPYKCEYCLSSLDKSVRSFDLNVFLAEMKALLDKGCRTFKFVDRTFNLSPTTSVQILEFFYQYVDLGLFLHFELVPDRLPLEIKEIIKKFPAGSLQFEVGIQTLNPVVAQNVSRKNDLTKVKDNFNYLKNETHVHTHADLIVGLPGETVDSFAAGFNQLFAMGPDEVQVGILKRLKGTPIIRHDLNYAMIYDSRPPFQILQNKDIAFATMNKMIRFAKYWDLIANSGRFPHLMKFLSSRFSESMFDVFWKVSEQLTLKHGQGHSISLLNLSISLKNVLIENFKVEVELAKEVIRNDYCYSQKKRDIPFDLMSVSDLQQKKPSHLKSEELNPSSLLTSSAKSKRQVEHSRGPHVL